MPVRVNLTMSSLDVADAIRVALADHLGNGNVDAIKSRNEAIQIIDYGVGDPGPLGLSGPSDPTTALAGPDCSAICLGPLTPKPDRTAGDGGQPGALRMWDNQHEGVYIDNIVIGFASRGEMVTGSAQRPARSSSPIPRSRAGKSTRASTSWRSARRPSTGRRWTDSRTCSCSRASTSMTAWWRE